MSALKLSSERNLDSGPLPQGFHNLTVTSGIRSCVQRTPKKIAITCGAKSRTYQQLIDTIHRVANGVEALGLKPGQNAAIISPNAIEYIEIIAGVSEIGAATATPNPRLTARELADICNDAQARVLFVHRECEKNIDASLFETVEHVIWIEGVGQDGYDAFIGKSSSEFTTRFIPEWSTFSIPYTSGTTGKPKGVLLSHRARTMAFLNYAGEYGIYSPEDHFLAIAPMCHGAGLAYAMASVFSGGSVEILAKFDAETVLRRIHSGEVTGLFSVPTHYHAIFSLPEELLKELKGNKLRGIVVNAAPLPQKMKQDIVDYFGEGLLHESYGSTEAGVVTNLRPPDQLRKINCVGLPFGGNLVKLLDNDGKEVGTDEVGELFSMCAGLFNGYWRKDEATKEAFRDGWVSVGDMAKRDSEGFYYIVDRKKDMVITGGLNVYPREIEDVLNMHKDVMEIAVIGVPDPQWGEKLVSVVVMKRGKALSAEIVESLEETARKELAPYKHPKQYLPLDALPRNANGKVLKTSLREWYAKTHAAEQAA